VGEKAVRGKGGHEPASMTRAYPFMLILPSGLKINLSVALAGAWIRLDRAGGRRYH
jgi:hypothetical protein